MVDIAHFSYLCNVGDFRPIMTHASEGTDADAGISKGNPG